MSCAHFRLEESKVRLPLFPSEAACAALDETDHPSCCCRRHQGKGWYVVGACGHAHGWNLHYADAEAQRTRLDLACAWPSGSGRWTPPPIPPDQQFPRLQDNVYVPAEKVVELPPPSRQ